MNIGDIAGLTGTKAVTIRYYERIGLMPSPARTSSNYRSYGQDELERLGFIRRCRDLGFGIDAIRELLELSEDKAQDCGSIDHIAAEHLAVVESKIADLGRLAAELRRISEQCKGGVVADCRVIEAISRPN